MTKPVKKHYWIVKHPDEPELGHYSVDGRKCPVCLEPSDSWLPIRWRVGGIVFEAQFCEEHGPGDLNLD